MPFRTIDNLKLGTMKKPTDWCFSPNDYGDEVLIQSDKRIAKINLVTGKGLLSDGKGGHPGSHKLHPALGAVEIIVSAADLERLKQAHQGNANCKPGQGIILTGERAGQVV
jgi:hypothetical protein